MIKIGITGSIASGKSTVLKYFREKNISIFSADVEVSKIYKNKNFLKKIKKIFNLKNNLNIKIQIKKKIKKDKNNLDRLEKIIHPIVRKKMKLFFKAKKNKRLTMSEVPLLIENKLNKYFDIIVFVDAKKTIRLKRYMQNKGEEKIFLFLNKRQLSRKKKIQKSNYVINNNKTMKELKKNVNSLFNNL